MKPDAKVSYIASLNWNHTMLNAHWEVEQNLVKLQGGPVHGKGFCFPAGIMPAYNIPDVEGNEPWNAAMWQCDLRAVRKYCMKVVALRG